MRPLCAILAVVVLTTSAMAAHITATPPAEASFSALSPPADLLSELAAPGMPDYESLMLLDFGPLPVGTDLRGNARVPEPAAFGLAAMLLIFVLILAWGRHAIRHVHRASARRRRRTDRPMAHI